MGKLLRKLMVLLFPRLYKKMTRFKNQVQRTVFWNTFAVPYTFYVFSFIFHFCSIPFCGCINRIVLLIHLTDVEDVKYVINFDYPSSSEDYIHRIGRTGRSQQTGTAYAFFTPQNVKHAIELVSVLSEANQDINPKLAEMANMFTSGSMLPKGWNCYL